MKDKIKNLKETLKDYELYLISWWISGAFTSGLYVYAFLNHFENVRSDLVITVLGTGATLFLAIGCALHIVEMKKQLKKLE
ncbi:MAG: hypothetical protein K1W00_06105 [Lachnospiraceae bacterium]